MEIEETRLGADARSRGHCALRHAGSRVVGSYVGSWPLAPYLLVPSLAVKRVRAPASLDDISSLPARPMAAAAARNTIR